MDSQRAIDLIFAEGLKLSQYLADSRELSFLNYHDDQFRKALLLASASRFESEIKAAVLAFVTERTAGDPQVVALIKAKAIERQYHTMFKWDGQNANLFFSLFGSEFKDYASEKVTSNSALNEAVKTFLELGNLRNQLVHSDYASFPLDKTAEEIYLLHKQAEFFVDSLPSLLRCQI